MYRYLSTSRGAGNLRIAGKISDVTRIATYLPREGPETHHKEKLSLFQQGIYSYLSTSRGDLLKRLKDSESKRKSAHEKLKAQLYQ